MGNDAAITVAKVAAAWGVGDWGQAVLTLLNSEGGQLALKMLFADHSIDEKTLVAVAEEVKNRHIPPPRQPEL